MYSAGIEEVYYVGVFWRSCIGIMEVYYYVGLLAVLCRCINVGVTKVYYVEIICRYAGGVLCGSSVKMHYVGIMWVYHAGILQLYYVGVFWRYCGGIMVVYYVGIVAILCRCIL